MKTARMSGHHISVTRDTTVSDEAFDSQVEIEPGVFVDPSTLEGFNVAYKTTKTVVTVRSNMTEEERSETEESHTRKIESFVTENDFVKSIEESDLESAHMVEEESVPEPMEQVLEESALTFEESIPFDSGDGFVSVESAPGATGDSTTPIPSTPVSPSDASSSNIADGTPSDSTSSMDDQERTRRSKKSRKQSKKGMKLPGILSCTRKRTSVHSSSSEEDDSRPAKLPPLPEPNQATDAAINAKLQEIAITISWISTRRVR